MLPGFLLGALLFLRRLTDDERLLWEVAAGQTHGHLQLFGWASMIVLGVGMHFLPRLRGAPPVNDRLAMVALALLTSGLLLRTISQPLAASDPAGFTRAGFALSGVLEFIGALVAVCSVVLCLAQPTPKQRSKGIRQTMPFLFVAGIAYLLANLANMAGVVSAGRDSRTIVTSWATATILLGFYGLLVPIAFGMSIRLFPLYIQTYPARIAPLTVALMGLELGLLFRIWGTEREAPALLATGKLLQATALLTMIVAIRIFDSRRPLPRRQVQPLTDPIQLHILAAYLWLAVVAGILALSAISNYVSGIWTAPEDAEFHALGAGFVTVLILGVGTHLLPGFAKKKFRSLKLAWATLLLANIAVVLRLIPELTGTATASVGDLAGTLAGLIGGTAIIAFAVDIGIGRAWFQRES